MSPHLLSSYPPPFLRICCIIVISRRGRAGRERASRLCWLGVDSSAGGWRRSARGSHTASTSLENIYRRQNSHIHVTDTVHDYSHDSSPSTSARSLQTIGLSLPFLTHSGAIVAVWYKLYDPVLHAHPSDAFVPSSSME
ncbi:hypothetical protein PILCRDRAFT_545892 [Piloderma croceum F 1598]|uniref:Uncharacterized protein n=1 Tax=Piloderma croceum (strain F 1598) TaxID=765440 RepID=A0A0C3BR69_PILCF|nr:hypothetical protein PILCRDRAFT_545892 [Piloderma croceum F 1598]